MIAKHTVHDCFTDEHFLSVDSKINLNRNGEASLSTFTETDWPDGWMADWLRNRFLMKQYMVLEKNKKKQGTSNNRTFQFQFNQTNSLSLKISKLLSCIISEGRNIISVARCSKCSNSIFCSVYKSIRQRHITDEKHLKWLSSEVNDQHRNALGYGRRVASGFAFEFGLHIDFIKQSCIVSYCIVYKGVLGMREMFLGESDY